VSALCVGVCACALCVASDSRAWRRFGTKPQRESVRRRTQRKRKAPFGWVWVRGACRPTSHVPPGFGRAQELFAKIRDIKAKADRSEVMVMEICAGARCRCLLLLLLLLLLVVRGPAQRACFVGDRGGGGADISQLDTAKKNLTLTITALKRLEVRGDAPPCLRSSAARVVAHGGALTAVRAQMLVKGVERLTDHAERKEYKDAAEILEAVTSLFTHFKDYTAVPKARSCYCGNHGPFLAPSPVGGVWCSRARGAWRGAPAAQVAELVASIARVKDTLKIALISDFEALTTMPRDADADSSELVSGGFRRATLLRRTRVRPPARAGDQPRRGKAALCVRRRGLHWAAAAAAARALVL
jgi:hypothetical protein